MIDETDIHNGYHCTFRSILIHNKYTHLTNIDDFNATQVEQKLNMWSVYIFLVKLKYRHYDKEQGRSNHNVLKNILILNGHS